MRGKSFAAGMWKVKSTVLGYFSRDIFRKQEAYFNFISKLGEKRGNFIGKVCHFARNNCTYRSHGICLLDFLRGD